MNFDLQLPADCPKANADEFTGIAYRVVKTNPPTHNDLLTYFELDLLPAADSCKRCSISLFSTLNQARHRIDVSPHLGPYVASIALTATHGKVGGPSKSGHIDWWPYQGMRKHTDFQVIE